MECEICKSNTQFKIICNSHYIICMCECCGFMFKVHISNIKEAWPKYHSKNEDDQSNDNPRRKPVRANPKNIGD